ncbi:hypothetical protein AGMMS50256_30750 [Betaproteobacteria bacterium]|nr:hypothetical protein AGMMS50256_30750 [Betaproteobacteria bacterium]
METLGLVFEIIAALFVISMVMGVMALLFAWRVVPFWKKQAKYYADYERALEQRLAEIESAESASGFRAWSEHHPG